VFTTINSTKFLSVAILATGAFTGLLASTSASASPISGAATISIDNAAVKAAHPSEWYFQTFFGPSDNAVGINLNAPGGTALDPNGVSTQTLAVNTNLTTIVVTPPAPPSHYGRTLQATTMDTSDASTANANGKQVGLEGAFRMTETGTSYLAPQDLRLVKTAGEWFLQSFDSGFQYANLFKIGDITDTMSTNGQLSGNLYFTSGFSWGGLIGADPTVSVGTFNLAPAAVPVPAAIWLFGSGLLGLLGSIRKKATMAA
jgi:hypothetical protein